MISMGTDCTILKDWVVRYIFEGNTFGYEFNKSDIKNLDYKDLLDLRDALEDIVIDIDNELDEFGRDE